MHTMAGSAKYTFALPPSLGREPVKILARRFADVLYSADSESNTARNRGWRRGIYIGSARTGFVTAFIPDPEADPDNSGTSAAEGVAVDAFGNVYGAEVGPRMLRKYVRRSSGVHR